MTKPKPKRRWVQVSLRTVLVLVTLLCVALSMWVVPAERQRQAVAAVQTLGGGIVFRMQPTGDVFRRSFPKTYLYEVEEVDLTDTQLTDAGLTQLVSLTSLRSLRLEKTQVTDAGLAYLHGLTSLRRLHLVETQIKDDGLAHVRELTNLQELHLDYTQVTDAGLLHLRGLTSLKGLSFTSTKITDVGWPASKS